MILGLEVQQGRIYILNIYSAMLSETMTGSFCKWMFDLPTDRLPVFKHTAK